MKAVKDFIWQWFGIDALNTIYCSEISIIIDDVKKDVADINLRMEHLAKRMDEVEVLLKRIRSHVGYHG